MQLSPKLKAVIAVPLREELCQLIEQIEPRLELLRDHSLTPPMRGPADWSGDPAFVRTERQQLAFDRMVDSADVLFGIPDVNPAALKRTVLANPQLRWVMTTAAGGGAQVQSANLSPAQLQRVIFTTTAGIHGQPLAEFALFGVLAGAKDLPRLSRAQSKRHWEDRWEMRQLSQLTVLIVGLGGIGSECARLFHAMGAQVWGTSRSGEPIANVDRIVSLEELSLLGSQVDALVVTLPGTDATRYFVNDELLSSFRPGAIMVNVGRGSVVDEQALLRALDSGQISFAALDVFESEPLSADSPLWDHPLVLISPHTAALTSAEEELIARRFASEAGRFIDGVPLRNVVDTVDFY